MSERDFYNQEHPQHPEFDPLPEHSSLPEYSPLYPDITFFQESSVTCREENIFQGRPPEGEPSRSDRREERRKRERYSILHTLLGSAMRGGAVVLATMTAVAVITASADSGRGQFAPQIAEAVESARRPAFTQQIGYDSDDFVRLWAGDPDAPHKYDLDNPIIAKEPTCLDIGEVEFVCTECGVHMHGTLPAGGHQPSEAMILDKVEATCLTEGSYREYIRCSVCGETLKDETVIVAKAEHTPGKTVRSREVSATCTTEGSYTEITPCTVCGREISRTVMTLPALGHTEAQAVRENETAATCTEDGSYEEVIYCSVCGEELSRTATVEAATGHTAAEAVHEHENAATCTVGGSYEEVVYCSACGAELSRSTVTVQALGHTAGSPKTENLRVDNCLQGGIGEEVVYCSTCGAELSRTQIDIAPKQHTAGTPKKVWIYGYENNSGVITGPDCLDGGAYENVTYCSVCGAEMAHSEEIQVDPPGHTFSTNPSRGQVLKCSVCGTPFIEAVYYGNNYITFYLDTDCMTSLANAGKQFDTVKLWSYSNNAYINQGGYEYGDSGSISIPYQYAAVGERFRVDWFFTNGSYVSSNDVVQTQ
ncbi:MAG: hypothetical protein IJL66_01630 [Lachnospiraceae bacterium]|nr:hypothetical protein [Lachnospiraceae bacterium]